MLPPPQVVFKLGTAVTYHEIHLEFFPLLASCQYSLTLTPTGQQTWAKLPPSHAYE